MLALRDGPDAHAQAALAALCEIYWFPIYAFIRRSEHSADDARDLTQAFFAATIEKGWLRQAHRERGRLRSFLLAAVRHFLANERDAARAQKRGGLLAHVSFEFDDGERRYAREPLEALTPEDMYDRRWAAQVIAGAWVRLEEKHGAGWMRGSRFFAPLKEHVMDDGPESYASLAARLETSEGTLRVTLHRMRQQFSRCLRDVIADTVDGEEAVDQELKHLLAVVSRR